MCNIGRGSKLDCVEGGPQLALKLLGDSKTTLLGDLVGRKERKSQFTGALNEFQVGKLRLKMKLRQYSIWQRT